MEISYHLALRLIFVQKCTDFPEKIGVYLLPNSKIENTLCSYPLLLPYTITPTRKNYAVQLLQIASWQARKNLNRINEFQVIGSDKVVLKPFYYSS